MSSSCIKYPASSNCPDCPDCPAVTSIAFSVENRAGVMLDIDNIQLINGVDDPFILPIPATGYESFPLLSFSGTGLPHYIKADIDITNPPTAIRIFYTAIVSTGYAANAIVLGNTVTSNTDIQGGGGSYVFDVPVDFALGNPAHLIFASS